MTTQLTPEDQQFIAYVKGRLAKKMNGSIGMTWDHDEIESLLDIIEQQDRAYDALRRGYYPGDVASEPAAELEALSPAQPSSAPSASETPYPVRETLNLLKNVDLPEGFAEIDAQIDALDISAPDFHDKLNDFSKQKRELLLKMHAHKPAVPAQTSAVKLSFFERKTLQTVIDAGGWRRWGAFTPAQKNVIRKHEEWFRTERYGGEPGYALTPAGRRALDAQH